MQQQEALRLAAMGQTPIVGVHPDCDSPTTPRAKSVLTESLDHYITYDDFLDTVLEVVMKKPFKQEQSQYVKTCEVVDHGPEEFECKVMLNGEELDKVGKGRGDGSDILLHHSWVKYSREERWMTHWDLMNLKTFPKLPEGRGLPWKKEDFAGSTWAWKHDGVNTSGMIDLRDDGMIQFNGMDPMGRWEVEEPDTFYITFFGSDFVLKIVEGNFARVVEPPARTQIIMTRFEGNVYSNVGHCNFLKDPFRIEFWTIAPTGQRRSDWAHVTVLKELYIRPALHDFMSKSMLKKWYDPETESAKTMTEMCKGKGHWVWVRDEGLDEFYAALEGLVPRGVMVAISKLFGTHAEFSFFINPLNVALCEWSKNKTTGSWGKLRQVDTWMLSPGAAPPDQTFTGMDGKIYTGQIHHSWTEEGQFVTEWKGKRMDGSPVHYATIKEVKDDELYNHLHDKVLGIHATRVFNRFPWYIIINKTEQLCELSIYGESDFVYLFPAKKELMIPGFNIFDASAPDVLEEQGVFKLGDGRTCKGVTLSAFEHVILEIDMFDDAVETTENKDE